MLANLSKLVKKEFEPQNLLCWLVLLLPLGTAKHFVGSYSYVNGYLVDYLVPAFYVSEILVWGVILSFFVRLRRTRKFPTVPATLRLRGGQGFKGKEFSPALLFASPCFFVLAIRQCAANNLLRDPF